MTPYVHNTAHATYSIHKHIHIHAHAPICTPSLSSASPSRLSMMEVLQFREASPSGQPITACVWFSNWQVTQPYMV
jgi:hypothetical protein